VRSSFEPPQLTPKPALEKSGDATSKIAIAPIGF